MKQKAGFLLIAIAMVLPSWAAAAVSPEELSLYESAHQVIEQIEKAMEQPFQTAFDPQICLEQSKTLRAYFKKNQGAVSGNILKVLQEEITLFDIAMDYFKTVGMARPSLNALSLTQKQYKAAKMKEDFKAAKAVLEKHFQEISE